MGVSPASVSGLLAIQQQGTPSQPKNYLLSASDFPTNECHSINSFTVIAPKDFEVSAKKDGPYQDFLTINSDADDTPGFEPNLANLQTSLFVRLKAGLAEGNYSGDVLHIHPLTGVRILAVSGTVQGSLQPAFTLSNTSFTNLATIKGQPSTTRGYLAILNQFSPNSTFTIAVTATSGLEVSAQQTGPFGATASVSLTTDKVGSASKGVFVRLKAGNTTGSVNGTVQHKVGGLSANLSISGTITAGFSVSVNPGSLSGFKATQGTLATSADAKSFTVSVKGLSTQNGTPLISVTAPTGYLVALSSNPAAFVKALGLPADGGQLNATIFVRLDGNKAGNFNGNVAITNAQIETRNVPVSGTISPKPLIKLAVNPTSISGFQAKPDQPSGGKPFGLQMSGLSADAVVHVDASFGFGVSDAQQGSYAEKMTLSPNSKGCLKKTLYARLRGITPVGELAGTVTISVEGGPSAKVKVKGKVNATLVTPVLKTNPATIAGFQAIEGSPSEEKTFVITATNLPKGSDGLAAVDITPPAGYELEFATHFFDALRLGNSNGDQVGIRLKSNLAPGQYKGDVVLSDITKKTIFKIPVNGIVLAKPAFALNPTSLSGFQTIEGSLAKSTDAKSFTLSVTRLSVKNGIPLISVAAPVGYLVALSSNPAAFVKTLALQANGGRLSVTIFVRLDGNKAGTFNNEKVTITNAQVTPASVTVSGTILPKGQPTLTVNPTSLSGFTTSLNKASATKSYAVQATQLASGVSATASAPTGYELSLQNSGPFSTSLTILQSNGAINATVFVRLKSQSKTGTFTGSIQNTVAGISKTVSVSGTVNSSVLGTPTVTVNPAKLDKLITEKGIASAVKSYTVTAADFPSTNPAKKLVIKAAIFTEISKSASGPFTTSLSLSLTNGALPVTTIFFRIAASAPSHDGLGSFVHSVDGKDLAFVQSQTQVVNASVTVNPGILSGFTAVQGTLASAKDAKSFSLSVKGLPAKETPRISITAPTGYLVGLSSNPAAFVKALGLPASNGQLTATIFVRLDGNKAGNFSGNVTIAGNLIVTKNVPVSGTILSKPTALIDSAQQSARQEVIPSAEEQLPLPVTAFPNPVEDILTVEFTAPTDQPIQIRLLDLQGTSLAKHDMQSAGGTQRVELPMSGRAAGIYLVDVITPLQRRTVKVLKQ